MYIKKKMKLHDIERVSTWGLVREKKKPQMLTRNTFFFPWVDMS